VSEEDVRGGLRDAVADEPPLDFDPDAVVAAARQQVTRRRALVAAGVATAVVAVAAVAVPVALGRAGTTQVGQQPPPPATTPSATSTPWPTTSVTPAYYTAEDLTTRGTEMAAHLRETVPTVLPSATEFEYGEFGGEAAGAVADGQMYLDAPVEFTIDGERYSLFVTAWAPGAPQITPIAVCAGSGVDCEPLSERAGGPVVLKNEDLGEGMITTLYHFRPSGGVVQIAAYNYDMTSNGPPKYEPSIRVTVDQLARLATDPELGL
jgi:hypothetical protein